MSDGVLNDDFHFKPKIFTKGLDSIQFNSLHLTGSGETIFTTLFTIGFGCVLSR